MTAHYEWRESELALILWRHCWGSTLYFAIENKLWRVWDCSSGIVLRWLVHCAVLKMSGAAEASFVVEPYQFEPILMESDRESYDDDLTKSDNGGYDMNEDRIGQVHWWAFVSTLHRQEGISEF